MEDEEYYHLMMEDLERLERVHHHRESDAEFLQWEARQQQISMGINFKPPLISHPQALPDNPPQ